MLKRIINTWATKKIINESKLYRAVEYGKKRSKTVYVLVTPTSAGVYLAKQGDVAFNNAIMFYLAGRLPEAETNSKLKKIFVHTKRPTIIPVVQAMLSEDMELITPDYGKIILDEEL